MKIKSFEKTWLQDKAQALQASRLSQLSTSRWSATPETPTELSASTVATTQSEAVAAPSTRKASRKRQSIEPVPAHLVEPKRLAPDASFPATPETSPLALSSSSSLSPSADEGARRPFAPLKDEEDSTGSSLSATDLAEEIDLPLEDDLQPIT